MNRSPLASQRIATPPPVLALPLLHHFHDEAIGLRHRLAEASLDPRQAKIVATQPLDLGQANGACVVNHSASLQLVEPLSHSVDHRQDEIGEFGAHVGRESRRDLFPGSAGRSDGEHNPHRHPCPLHPRHRAMIYASQISPDRQESAVQGRVTKPFRRSRARHIVYIHAPARSHFSFTIAKLRLSAWLSAV